MLNSRHITQNIVVSVIELQIQYIHKGSWFLWFILNHLYYLFCRRFGILYLFKVIYFKQLHLTQRTQEHNSRQLKNIRNYTHVWVSTLQKWILKYGSSPLKHEITRYHFRGILWARMVVSYSPSFSVTLGKVESLYSGRIKKAYFRQVDCHRNRSDQITQLLLNEAAWLISHVYPIKGNWIRKSQSLGRK